MGVCDGNSQRGACTSRVADGWFYVSDATATAVNCAGDAPTIVTLSDAIAVDNLKTYNYAHKT